MFKGSMTALATPFAGDALDLAAFEALVERQLAGGTSVLVPCGTTGESATLQLEEQAELARICVRLAKNRAKVVVGAGTNDTASTLRQVQQAAEIGADGVMLVTPYYNKPSQQGLLRHFGAAADASPIPVILYNVPGRTAVDLLPETLGELAKHPRIVGLKDATGDMGRVLRHRALVGEAFSLLSGDDFSAVGFRALGGDGAISVTSNIAPDLCARLHAACDQGDFATARMIDAQLMPLHKALFAEPSPGPLKAAMELLGQASARTRSPLAEQVSAGTRAALADALKQAGL